MFALSAVTVVGLSPASATSDATVSADAPGPRALSVGTAKIAGGFAQPTAVTSPNDGTNRLFVAQRNGVVKRVVGVSVARRPYLDVRSKVNTNGAERGLLGIAFSPNFKKTKTLFFTYTRGNGAMVLARARVKKANSTHVSASTIRTLLEVAHPENSNHNGGSLAFANDGTLFVGTGDGGGGGDPFHRAQNLKSRAGKILRINPMKSCGTQRYCVPKSNPYAKSSGNDRLVWARGLRNPWRISVDSSTGNLWVADVGQDGYEEVSVIARGTGGKNLGWSCKEGKNIFNADQCHGRTLLSPVLTLCHPDGVAGCSAARSGEAIIGGYVYRGKAYPSLRGKYIFADFVTNNIYVYSGGAYSKAGQRAHISSFGLTSNQELVAVSLDGGLYRVTATA